MPDFHHFPPQLLCITGLVGLLSAYLAVRRGRNPYFWFLIGFLFGLLGLIAIFVVTREKKSMKDPISVVPQPYIDGPNHCFWYYLDPEYRQLGPMSYQALTEAWQKGELTSSTLVWHEDLPNWKELQEFIITPSSK